MRLLRFLLLPLHSPGLANQTSGRPGGDYTVTFATYFCPIATLQTADWLRNLPKREVTHGQMVKVLVHGQDRELVAQCHCADHCIGEGNGDPTGTQIP